MNRGVRITLELDQSMVKMLNANLQLSNKTRWLTGADDPPPLDAAGVVALVALAEARGATEEVIHAATPPEWRPHIRAIHEERRVLLGEDEEGPGGEFIQPGTHT